MKKIVAIVALFILSACGGKKEATHDRTELGAGDSASVTDTQVAPLTDGSKENNAFDCATHAGDAMCRPVLAEGEGDSVIVGSVELQGKFKIEYLADGKIAKMMRFDATQPDQPSWTKTLSYDVQGRVESVTIEDRDSLEKRTLIYTDGKLESESGSKKIGNNPLRILEKKYQDLTATMWEAVYKESDLNHDQVEETSFNGRLGGSGWSIEGNKRSEWSASANAMMAKSGEARISKYDATMHRKYDMYAYCDAAVGNNSDCDPHSNTFSKHYAATAIILYEGEDPVTSTTGIDGDKHDLQNNPSDGINDRNIDCTFVYDEANQLEPYPLPEEAKKMGISGKKAIQSIECNERNRTSVYKFKYKPLKDALAEK